MAIKYGSDNDPYCYTGTQVLINKLNIQDEQLLEEAEKEITLFTAEEIDFFSPPYDLNYWKTIHKQLFLDVFEWAGELRTVFITKGETQFCNPLYIEQEASRLFTQLKKESYYEDYSRDTLIQKSSELFAELNLLHPFREGNGRAQRILFEHFFENWCYDVDWTSASIDQWMHASIAGVDMNYAPIAFILSKCLSNNES